MEKCVQRGNVGTGTANGTGFCYPCAAGVPLFGVPVYSASANGCLALLACGPGVRRCPRVRGGRCEGHFQVQLCEGVGSGYTTWAQQQRVLFGFPSSPRLVDFGFRRQNHTSLGRFASYLPPHLQARYGPLLGAGCPPYFRSHRCRSRRRDGGFQVDNREATLMHVDGARAVVCGREATLLDRRRGAAAPTTTATAARGHARGS